MFLFVPSCKSALVHLLMCPKIFLVLRLAALTEVAQFHVDLLTSLFLLPEKYFSFKHSLRNTSSLLPAVKMGIIYSACVSRFNGWPQESADYSRTPQLDRCSLCTLCHLLQVTVLLFLIEKVWRFSWIVFAALTPAAVYALQISLKAFNELALCHTFSFHYVFR